MSLVWGYIGSPFFSRGEDLGFRGMQHRLLFFVVSMRMKGGGGILITHALES